MHGTHKRASFRNVDRLSERRPLYAFENKICKHWKIGTFLIEVAHALPVNLLTKKFFTNPKMVNAAYPEKGK